MTALTASPKQRSHWSAPSLEGQRIVLAGRASKWEKEQLIEVIQREKGVVVDQVAADVTLVIVLASGAVPPAVKKAEQLNKKSNASIEIIELEDFEKRLAPTQQEAIEMLRAGAAATERWEQLCTGRNSSLSLEGCDLRGLNLAAFSLENVKLDGADLRKSDLSRSNFDALCNVRLDGAVLAESSAESLENCSLVGADAKEFSVENWNSRKRTACNADFSKAKLVNATFSSVHGPNAKFTKTDLSSADVSECDFSGVDFSGAVLKEAVARKSEFDRCVFAKADLTHFDGAGSSFSGADFRGAKLKNANFFGADLTDALFEGADVSGANFAKAKYDPKQLTRAKGAVAGATTFTPGPRFQELEAAIKKAGNLYITGKLKAGGLDHNCSVSAGKGRGAKAVTISVARGRDDEDGNDHSSLTLYASNVKDAFESLIAYLGPGVVLDPEDVEVSSKSAYLDVARGGFCEPFGVVAPTAEERKAAEKIAKAERIALKKTLAQELQEGATGVKKWNARPAEDFKLLDNLNKLDLTNAQLDGWQLDGEKIKSRQRQTWGFPEFGEVKFNGTSLKNTNIHRIDFTKSSFTGATLQGGRINA
ncbi:MAG TPA: pentapeptide repeat-containing protein, partial [Pirellulales bacterium]